ncbi:DUF7793 family protein [Aurantibacillus circumpalustris]|uniref:DUF7793 family protein n=1 Tax=Aurantibacillus circumpalustris TaxID=3036359 RepID=UPI00295BD4FB|nr:hypothetical protein [Aurantibacillus circumpalustris]
MIKIQLDIAYLEYENNIVYVRAKDDLVLEKRDLQLLMETAIEMAAGEKYYALIDTSGTGESTPEARDYYSDSEFSKYRYADAYIVNSLATRLIVNFFIKFNKPKVKSRMFGTVEEATKWLEGLKKLQLV